MIDKLLQNNFFKTNNPIVLKNCTLFFRLKHFDIDNVFIFHRQDLYSFSTVGELWIKGQIKTEFNNKGYFYTNFYTLEHFNIIFYFDEYDEDEISIIGYYNNKKIQISGISLSKENITFSEGMAFKFSFIELKTY